MRYVYKAVVPHLAKPGIKKFVLWGVMKNWIEMIGRRGLVRDSGEIYTAKLLLFGLNIFVTILLAVVLSPASFGLFLYGVTLVNVTTICALCGFQHVVKHQIPRLRHDNDTKRLAEVLTYSRLLVFDIAVFLSIIVGCAQIFALNINVSVAFVALIALAVPLWTYIRLRAETLRAYGATFGAILPDDGLRNFAYLAVPALFFMLGRGAPDVEMLFGGLIVMAVVAFYTLWRLEHKYAVRVAGAGHSQKTRAGAMYWLKFAAPFGAVAAMQILLQRGDLLILANIAGEVQAGLYGLNVKLVQMVSFPAAAVAAAIAPALSAAYAAADVPRVRRTLLRASMASAGIGFCLAALLYLFAPVIYAVVGESYNGRSGLLPLLLASEICVALYMPLYIAYMMSPSRRFFLPLLASCLLLLFGLNLVLAEAYGATGAAMARLIAFSVLTTAMLTHSFVQARGNGRGDRDADL